MAKATFNFASSKQFLRAVVDALEEGLEEVGQKEDEAIRQAISVPVGYEYSREPIEFDRASGEHVAFWGMEKRIIRSNPGEPPRKETGTLYNSVMHNTTATKTGASVEIGAGPALAEDGFDYSGHLETALDRPYVSTSFKRAVESAPQILANKLSAVQA